MVNDSGMNEEGRNIGKACENVTIMNCTVIHGHGGVVIGSDMSGGVRNVKVSGCTFVDTDRGIRIKTCRGRGGVVENIEIVNINMQHVGCPFVVNCYYCCGSTPDDDYINSKALLKVDERTPILRDMRFINITAKYTTIAAGFLYGLPESPIDKLVFKNVDIEIVDDNDVSPAYPAAMHGISPMKAAGWMVFGVAQIRMDNVNIVRK